MIRIYADFNSQDQRERVRLNTSGSLEDIEKYSKQLRSGLAVILYMPDVEVEGVLEFDGVWLGIPDWSTTRHIEDA